MSEHDKPPFHPFNAEIGVFGGVLNEAGRRIDLLIEQLEVSRRGNALLNERVAELEAELKNLVFEVMDGPADICCGCDANPRDCEANRSKDPMVEAALKARAVLERKP